jgi:integrase
MAKRITAFVLDKVPNTNEARVRMRVKWEGSRNIVAMNVGHRVSVSRWDAQTQRCAPRSFHGKYRVPAALINTELDRYAEAVDDVFLAFDKAEKTPTATEVRDALAKRLKVQSSEVAGVFKAFDRYVMEKTERNRWSYRMIQKMQGLKAKLRLWRPHLSWEDFQEAGLYDFVSFLRGQTRTNHDKDSGVSQLKDSTVDKHVSALRWFLAWAHGVQLLPYADFKTFRPKLQMIDKPVIFLEWAELMTLYNAELKGAFAQVRDVFCFCCFTSLRYSDVYALRWADVAGDHIKVTTQKTDDSLVIELNKYSSDLIGRYVDESYPDDKVFPVLSNQKMNDRLKELCRLCGISRLVRVSEIESGERIDRLVPKWKLMSTHAGRRTFICNALMMGIPPNVVMRWTGHSDYDSMKPYIAIADSVKAQEMAKFDKLE